MGLFSKAVSAVSSAFSSTLGRTILGIATGGASETTRLLLKRGLGAVTPSLPGAAGGIGSAAQPNADGEDPKKRNLAAILDQLRSGFGTPGQSTTGRNRLFGN